MEDDRALPAIKKAPRSTGMAAADHFAFGRNWASYAKLVDESLIEESRKGLLRLVPKEGYEGCSFLDIGCGSGVHALAAARLGVRRITAIDIDPDCVAVANALLSKHNVTIPWKAEQISVFDLDPRQHGTYDVVYSWGVLHHTGDMWTAIRRASEMVARGGLLVIALYHATRFDLFWKLEKRWYAQASPRLQRMARLVYLSMFRLARIRSGGFQGFVKSYRSYRGMDFAHDVHDWLGGYPYETASPSDVETTIVGLGFVRERQFVNDGIRGFLAAPCDEYVFRRQ